MKKEKLLELVKKANFHYQCNLSYAETERFKNAVLDETIKELQELKLGIHDDGSLSSVHDMGENFGIDKAIRKIEAMK
jgi:hypothetical protein